MECCFSRLVKSKGNCGIPQSISWGSVTSHSPLMVFRTSFKALASWSGQDVGPPLQRIGDSVVDDGEHEDVDVGFAELPVGAVDCQAVLLLPGQLLEDKFSHKILTDWMFGEKSLYSPQTRVGFGGRVETGWKFAETHRSGLAQSHHKQWNQLDVGKIDVFWEKSC